MARTNIADYLEELGVKTPDDFFRKIQPRRWTAHLREYIIPNLEKEVPESLNTARNVVGGLKIHFDVTRDPSSGSVQVPSKHFIRKLSFYAKKTIITYPLHDLPRWDVRELRPLIALILDAKPLIKKGDVQILPQFYKQRRISSLLLKKNFTLLSANFDNPSLKRQFDEEFIRDKNIELYKPIFRDIDTESVSKIREVEKYLYDEFEADIANRLTEDPEHYEDNFLKLLKEINLNVLHLKSKYADVQRAILSEKYPTLISIATSAGLIAIFPPCTPLLLPAAVALAVKEIVELAKNNASQKTKLQALKTDKFFIVWHLSNMNTKCYDTKCWENVLMTDVFNFFKK